VAFAAGSYRLGGTGRCQVPLSILRPCLSFMPVAYHTSPVPANVFRRDLPPSNAASSFTSCYWQKAENLGGETLNVGRSTSACTQRLGEPHFSWPLAIGVRLHKPGGRTSIRMPRGFGNPSPRASHLAVGTHVHNAEVTGRLGGSGHVCATVEIGKQPARKKCLIPFRARSCAIWRPCSCTDFRHDSCNAAPG